MKKQTISTMLMLGILFMLMAPIGASAGKVIITFDDGLISTYNVAMPILENNSQKAVSFVYPETIIGSDGVYYTDFMNVNQVQELASLGWDISSHSYTHCCEPGINYLSTANNSALYYELVESKSWIWTSVPVSRGAMFFAYPYGEYGNPLPTNLRLSGYVAARTVESTPYYQDYVVGSDGAMKMTTMQVERPTTSDSIKSLIDEAVVANKLLILTFHAINDDSTDIYGYPTESFKNISDYLYQLNTTGKVQVTTFSEYFGVPATIDVFTPATPTETGSTSSRNSINFSWADGIGSVNTDVFDVTVNGVTTYFVSARSLNVPAQPGKRVDVSVVAINQSWGKRTLSLSSLSMNATIQGYMPSTPIGIASTMGNNWIKTNWTADDSGNKTDLFNVNVLAQSKSTWYNETTDTSVTTTGLSKGQSVTVKVYALNGTKGATTENSIPAELTTSLPITDMPIILAANSDSTNLKMSWTYKAGLNTTDVEITTIKRFENGTQISNIVEIIPLLTNNTGEKTVNNIPPHGMVIFSIRGANGTGPYSEKVYANQSLANNPVILSIATDYNTPPGSIFRLNPVVTDLDGDKIVFTAGSAVNDTSINTTTGEFVFNTVNATIGRYNFNITAKDDHGSNQTADFKVFVVNNPPPSSGSSGSSGGSGGGGGGAIGSSESFSNLLKYEVKDGYVHAGKDNAFEFKTLSQGIYQVILNGPNADITVRVDNLKGHQDKLDNVSGNALLYSNLMISSERMTGLSFKFKIDKSKITNAENVKAYVWTNNAWEVVDTNVLSSDENYVYFQSVSAPVRLSKLAFAETENVGTPSDVSSPDIVKAQPISAQDAVNGSNTVPNKAPGFGVLGVVIVVSILYLRRKGV